MRLSNQRYEEIKKIVVQLFEDYDVRCVPINAFELATRIGIILVPYSSLSKKQLSKVRNNSDDGFFLETEKNGIREYRIYYDDSKPYGRINHTIMHEIAHCVLDHQEGTHIEETEAAFFAKYALAPPPLIHKYELDTPEEISDLFDISYEAAIYAMDYYQKWLHYGSPDYTSYEKRMLHLFQYVSQII